MDETKLKRRSGKALSPVVASIILVATAVALSIAVGAWTGALTLGFTATEQLRITEMTFDTANNIISVTANNPGASVITINEAWINNAKQTATDPALPAPIGGNSQVVFNITVNNLGKGHAYQVGLVSSKGNKFLYTASD
jgi:hypothetical protein